MVVWSRHLVQSSEVWFSCLIQTSGCLIQTSGPVWSLVQLSDSVIWPSHLVQKPNLEVWFRHWIWFRSLIQVSDTDCLVTCFVLVTIHVWCTCCWYLLVSLVYGTDVVHRNWLVQGLISVEGYKVSLVNLVQVYKPTLQFPVSLLVNKVNQVIARSFLYPLLTMDHTCDTWLDFSYTCCCCRPILLLSFCGCFHCFHRCSPSFISSVQHFLISSELRSHILALLLDQYHLNHCPRQLDCV